MCEMVRNVSGACLVVGCLMATGQVCAAVENKVQPAEIAAQLPDLSHLKSYVGNYPLKDFVSGKTKGASLKDAYKNFKSVWDDPAFRKLMFLTMGKDVTSQILDIWGKKGLEQVPLQQKGNVLYTFAAKPMAAADNRVFIFVNLGSGPDDKAANTMQACWHWKSPKGQVYDYWLATGQPDRRLPPNACSWMGEATVLLANYGKGTLAEW